LSFSIFYEKLIAFATLFIREKIGIRATNTFGLIRTGGHAVEFTIVLLVIAPIDCFATVLSDLFISILTFASVLDGRYVVGADSGNRIAHVVSCYALVLVDTSRECLSRRKKERARHNRV